MMQQALSPLPSNLLWQDGGAILETPVIQDNKAVIGQARLITILQLPMIIVTICSLTMQTQRYLNLNVRPVSVSVALKIKILRKRTERQKKGTTEKDDRFILCCQKRRSSLPLTFVLLFKREIRGKPPVYRPIATKPSGLTDALFAIFFFSKQGDHQGAAQCAPALTPDTAPKGGREFSSMRTAPLVRH